MMSLKLDDLDPKSKKVLNEIRQAYRTYSCSALTIFTPLDANPTQIEAACSRAAKVANEMIQHEHRFVEKLLAKLTQLHGNSPPKC